MDKKIWFITGISSGLGKSLAEAVIKSGDFVVGSFRQKKQADDFNAIYKEKALGVTLDVTKHSEIEKVISKTVKTYECIDILVNNAGVGFAGAIEEASIEEARELFESNFFSVLKITQAVLPIMRSQGKGHIVQISSQGGIKATGGFGIYNATKFALEGFSEALAQEVTPLGIRVSIVEPGPFRTKFAGTSLKIAKAFIEDYASTAGAFRERISSIDGTQEGDPDKAAQAIIDYVKSNKPNLRLPLGKLAVVNLKFKIDSLIADLEANKKIAEAAVFGE